MKKFLLFILTTFIATGAMFAGLNSGHIVTGYGIAFLLAGLFFWRMKVRR